MKNTDTIVSKTVFLDSDTYQTQRNNNILVVGSSGGGKTRHVVMPNLLQLYGSYVISDPKGSLYREFAPYFRQHGYDIQVLNLLEPEQSDIYNPFHYLWTETDYIRFAHNLMYALGGDSLMADPFWDMSGQLLLTALVSVVCEYWERNENHLGTLMDILGACEVREDDESFKNAIDVMMEEVKERETDRAFAVRQYAKFKQAAGKTMKSILITINAKLGVLDTEIVRAVLGDEEAATWTYFNVDGEKREIDIKNIGKEKTAVFVISSDTDHSLDIIANVFYTQVFQELCRYADNECAGGRLPVPVRFILDDFAASARIPDFETLIATIRSREISVMAILQSESQLWAQYKHHAQTIIGNCDTYLYLGGNDLETARNIAERLNCPVGNVLYMETGKMYVFVRGRLPLLDDRYPLEEHPAYQELRELSEADDDEKDYNEEDFGFW